jgi:hypothetical protein
VAGGGGRLLRNLLGAVVFTSAASGAGALTYAGFGALGDYLATGPALGLLAAAVLVGSAFWYGKGGGHVPFGRQGVQSHRDLAGRGWLGLMYFGGLLGVGLLTQMSTPLVWAGVFVSLYKGPGWAFVYGIGFGVGRAIPVWVVAFLRGRFIPAELTAYLISNSRRLRWVGLATTLAAAGVMARLVARSG